MYQHCITLWKTRRAQPLFSYTQIISSPQQQTICKAARAVWAELWIDNGGIFSRNVQLYPIIFGQSLVNDSRRVFRNPEIWQGMQHWQNNRDLAKDCVSRKSMGCGGPKFKGLYCRKELAACKFKPWRERFFSGASGECDFADGGCSLTASRFLWVESGRKSRFSSFLWRMHKYWYIFGGI